MEFYDFSDYVWAAMFVVLGIALILGIAAFLGEIFFEEDDHDH